MSRHWVGRGSRAGAAVVCAASLTACVSTSPWRVCGPPCAGKQLERADAVIVDTRGATRVVLTQAKAGKDEHGPFLEGIGAVADQKVGPVKIYANDTCAVHTRRFLLSRAAANAVLVPLAVVGEIALAYYGGDVWDWNPPVEGQPPPGCDGQPVGDDSTDDGGSDIDG